MLQGQLPECITCYTFGRERRDENSGLINVTLNDMLMNAVIYLRVSTEEQSQSGLGLEAQETACRTLAGTLGASEVGGVLIRISL